MKHTYLSLLLIVLIVVPRGNCVRTDQNRRSRENQTLLSSSNINNDFWSVVGDPGMHDPTAVTWSGWSFCNRARAPRDNHEIPRWADCGLKEESRWNLTSSNTDNVDALARRTEAQLAQQCAHWSRNEDMDDTDQINRFVVSGWHVMFKSGNMNTLENLCPCGASPPHRCFPMYKGPGPMNQPHMVQQRFNGTVGYVAGTYDLDRNQTALTDALHSYTSAWILYRQQQENNNTNVTPPVAPSILQNRSFLFTAWWKRNDDSTQETKVVFYQGLQTSPSYPWLMNYLRCNQVTLGDGSAPATPHKVATHHGERKTPLHLLHQTVNSHHHLERTSGGYGGYPWGGFGIMKHAVGTYGRHGTAHLSVRLNILSASHEESHHQFYLPEWGGCWRLDGSPCRDAGLDVDWPRTDVTRYICFLALVVAAEEHHGCGPTPEKQKKCPPYHILSPSTNDDNNSHRSNYSPPHGRVVYRNDTENFPYHCYFLHCYAATDPTAPKGETCDPYSNPSPQEILQLLPCDEWGLHGFPTQPIDRDDDRSDSNHNSMNQLWNLDVGTLGARVFLQGQEPDFLWKEDQDEDLTPNDLPPGHMLYPGWNRRSWISFEVGPEQMDPQGRMIQWEVQDWDVRIPASVIRSNNQKDAN